MEHYISRAFLEADQESPGVWRSLWKERLRRLAVVLKSRAKSEDERQLPLLLGQRANDFYTPWRHYNE
jgi:hypothetical protein